MKKRLASILLFVFLALTSFPVLAVSDTITYNTYRLNGVHFIWHNGTPDQYGTPTVSQVRIQESEIDPTSYTLWYDRDYFEKAEFLGTYSFTSVLPPGTMDFLKTFESPFVLQLELDGTARFYPKGSGGRQNENPSVEPEPFADHLKINITLDPGVANQTVTDLLRHKDLVGAYGTLKNRVSGLAVTGTMNINTEFFKSVLGYLDVTLLYGVPGSLEDPLPGSPIALKASPCRKTISNALLCCQTYVLA